MNKKTFAFVCVLAIFLPQVAWCGTGSYVGGNPDLIQLLVSFEYNETDMASWAPLFREASRLLFDATEKQVKIGRITLFKSCPDLVNRADVRIFLDTRGANANVGGLGRSGTRIRLSQTHKTVTTAGLGNRGQLGLVHELGHYAFGLLDEYLDKQEARTQDAFCVDSGGTTATLMDGGTTVATKNQRTELCTATNHRRGMTAQDRRRPIGSTFFEDTDDWHWLAAWVRERYGQTLTVPANTPIRDDSGFGPEPVIEIADCDLRVSVSIDSSGSMSASPELRGEDEIQGESVGEQVDGDAPISVAKEAAGKFLRLLEEGEAAGVVGVGEDVELIPLREMRIDERFRSIAALENLAAGGRTTWRRLLGEPLEQLAGEDEAEIPGNAGNEVVLLISDGTTVSEAPSGELLSPLKDRGVVVHTIGLVNEEAVDLRRVASQTGGNFLFARTATEMDSHVLSVLAQMRSQGIIADQEVRIPAGGSRVLEIPIDEATAGKAADFLLSWSEGVGGLQMELIEPSREKLASDDPNSVFQDDLGRKLKRYRVQQPERGVWTVRLTNKNTSPRNVNLQVHALTNAVTVASYAEKDVLELSEPMVIRAVVTTDDPVGGATVTARIARPLGGAASIQLFDDGHVEHADDRANDGTYSNVFKDYTGSGSYTIDVTVDAAAGFTVSVGEDGGEFTSEPVEPFVRKSKFSVIVRDASN